MDEYAFPARPEEVRGARRWARTVAPAEVAEDAELIVSELVSNAVRYGATGAGATVTLRLAARRGRLRITVTNPTGPPSGIPAGQLDEHGRGLMIVAAIAALVEVAESRGLTEARAELDIPGAEHVADEPQPTTPQPVPEPEPSCPGLGRPHLVASATGPGGRATRCTACYRPEVPVMLGEIRRWTYDERGPDGRVVAYVTVHVPPGEERPASLADVPPEWIENRKPAYRAT